MPHARTQIRNAVITDLTSLPSIQGRIFAGRMTPVDPRKQGGTVALVFCRDEPEISAVTLHHPVVQQRVLELVVRGVAKAPESVDDELDQFALEVESAMSTAPTLGALLKNPAELASVRAGVDESLEQPAGVIELTYRITYMVMSNAPGVLP